MVPEQIQTGVDKLVALVRQTNKISFKDAAKKLGVSPSTISEWANLLEEEGIIDINYKFTSPFLINKQLTKEEKKEKIQEFEEEKQIFDKRVDSATGYLNGLDEEIGKINSLFKDLEKHLSPRLKHIEGEIGELKKIEKEKEGLNESIVESKQNTLKKIQEINSHILKEKQLYNKLCSEADKNVKKDKHTLKQQEDAAAKIKLQEDFFEKKLAQVRQLSETIQKQIEQSKENFGCSDKELCILKKKRGQLLKELEEEENNMKELIISNEKAEENLSKLQKDVFKKLEAKEKEIEEEESNIKNLPSKFKEFLERKSEIVKIVNRLNQQELALKEELREIIQKAKILRLSLNSEEYKKQIAKLNERIDKFGKKKSFLDEEIKKLVKLLKW